MYKVSSDRRFQKNKREIRKAYISLVQEKGYQNVTISDIAQRADINRMTFYSHYDIVEDIFIEFVDEMESRIISEISSHNIFNLDIFFELLNNLMYQEIDFFRYIAKEGNCADFRSAFVKTIEKIIILDLDDKNDYSETQKKITGNLIAVSIAYAYLDWLSGDFGSATLDEVISTTKELLKDNLSNISFTNRD